MSKETEPIAITNGDADDPIQVSVVHTTTPGVNGVVILRPDGNLI